jgi:hypothetical protein
MDVLQGNAQRVILGLRKAPTARDVSQRINAAIDHVMV